MNHELLKNMLYALYDGQLPAENRPVLEAHLRDCPECRCLLDDWKRVSADIIRPLQMEGSEAFVQAVMRKVRVFGEQRGWLGWPRFVRWAYPALALSMAGFAAAFFFVVQPATYSADPLQLEDSASVVPTEWAAPPNEDKIFSSVVEQ